MVVLSKLFVERLRHCECRNDLIHERGCLFNAAWRIYRLARSGSLYFAPLIFMPLVVKLQKLNRELLLDTCKYFVETVVSGIVTTWPIVLTLCALRRLLGDFRLYTLAYIPALVGGLSGSLWYPPRVRRMFYNSTLQCILESMVIRREHPLARLMADSMAFQTLVFMCCSTVIMHAKRHRRFRGFWFLRPNAETPSEARRAMAAEEDEALAKHPRDDDTPAAFNAHCTHEDRSCARHLRTGVQNYLAIGLTLDLIKMLMSRAPPSAAGLLAKLSTFRPRSAAFLASYVGLYRFTHCYLNRKTQSSRDLNHLLAAFLGGVSYTLCPKLTLRCYSVVVCLEILWTQFQRHRPEKPSRVLELLQSNHLPQLAYIFSLGYLVHAYTLRPHKVSSLGEIIINGLTDNFARDVGVKVRSIEKMMEGLRRS